MVFLTSFEDSDRTAEELPTQVRLLAEHGATATFADFRQPPTVPLALLSEKPGWLSDEDRDLVRKFVPWNRIVRAELPDRLLDEPGRFVLKGSSGLSGKEVYFGAHCAPGEWRQLVASAVESEYYVAQEFDDHERVYNASTTDNADVSDRSRRGHPRPGPDRPCRGTDSRSCLHE
jgi:hypothetical protein